MPTVKDHIEGIWTNLGDHDRHIQTLLKRVEDLEAQLGNPLEQDIDLDLPHASAGNAVPGSTAGREATVETDVTDDALTVRLPAATSEQKAARRRFAAEVLDLNSVFPDLAAEGGLDAVGCYAEGGPMWLYLGSKESRDHILTLPTAWRQAMVEDVAQFSAQEAHEFGRDILKDTEPAAGMDVTYDYLLSTVDA